MKEAIGRLFGRLKEKRGVKFLRRYIKAISDDDLAGVSAEMAYRLFLSLFPFFIFLGAMCAFTADLLDINNPTDEIIQLLGDSIPPDVSSVLRSQIEEIVQSQDLGLLSIGIFGALWTASSGFMTLIKGMNRVYESRESRPVWKRYLLAVGLTLLAGGSLIVAFLILIVGQIFGNQIADELGMQGQAVQMLSIARWFLVVLFVLVAVALIYWITPSKPLPFRFITPGSVLFTIAWVVLNLLFGLYIGNFGAYDSTYGALGGVVVVLLWFYLTAFLLFLGAVLNQMLFEAVEEGKDPAEIKPASTARAAIEEPSDAAAVETTGVPEAAPASSEQAVEPAARN